MLQEIHLIFESKNVTKPKRDISIYLGLLTGDDFDVIVVNNNLCICYNFSSLISNILRFVYNITYESYLRGRLMTS